MHPQIILKSRTPEIRFPASWEVIFYRKAHSKLEVLERVDRTERKPGVLSFSLINLN